MRQKSPPPPFPKNQGPAAQSPAPKTRARRTNKLSESLKSPPTVVRKIIHLDVIAAPDDFRLLGEETSERLHVKPAALTQKFCYHGTFYREQWKLKAAHGVELTRNLMCSWHDHILIGEDAQPSFNSHLQSDGLRAYRTFIERHGDLEITPVSRLTHVTRKLKEARDEHLRITARLPLPTGSIYQVEKRLCEENTGPLNRQCARWLRSRKTYDQLSKMFRRLARFRGITPRSKLGNALAYAANQWPHLDPCVIDGQIEFDNNLNENSIRPTKLGHKNWIFIGGEHTGWRSAVIYTFVEQVRRHGADPFAYFEWVFEQLMHDPAQEALEALLPANRIKTRPTACQTIESRVA